MKKIPMRSCVITKEKLPKNELLRVVKTNDGVVVDLTGKVNGHGVYLKRDENVINDAIKKKALDRLLETSVDDNIYDELIKNI